MVVYCVDVDDACVDETPARRAGPQKLIGAGALACIALAAGLVLYNNLAADRADDIVTPPKVTIVTAQPAARAAPARTAQAKSARPDFFVAPGFDVSLFDGTALMPTTFSAGRPVKLATYAFRPVAAPAPSRIVQAVPLPTPRPAELAQLTSPPPRPPRERIAAAAATQGPFDQFLGRRDTDLTMAYAPTDGSVFNNGQSRSPGRGPTNDSATAVYDITARTVYMPDGTTLEAHSGLRDKLDDPRYVNVRMHGATPPHTYDLVPRESLFHGVEAIRLIPVGGEDAIFGRSGLLAHTFMLGPNGDSNGCVSFRDYAAFLRAYKQGKVKRLVVVASGGRGMLASNN